MDSLSEPTNNNNYIVADICLILSIIICSYYFVNFESSSFGFLFTFVWLSLSWLCYHISRFLLFLWGLAAGFLLGFMFFVLFRFPDRLNDVFRRLDDLGFTLNSDQVLIFLLIILILYFLIVWVIGKTGDLQVSGACVLVGAVSPIVLSVELLFPPIAAIALGGLVYIGGILFLSSIPILSIGLGVYMYTKWNIIIIAVVILVLIIIFIKFLAKFFIAYAVCTAVGFIVLSCTQEVFSTANFLIQSASLIQQITSNAESLSHLFSVLLEVYYNNGLLTLDRYDLFNLFIKPLGDKFIILLSSFFLSIALSIGRFRFFRLNEKG